jgi:histidinol-phosphate phosphatase family protein
MPAASSSDRLSATPGPFVFLDRDGTLIEDRHYLADPAGVTLLPGVAEGLRLLRDAERRLVVLTNQSGVGRGFFTEAHVHAVHERMVELLLAKGVALDAIYFCPHAPEAACPCRKPAPGLALRALRDLGGSLAGAAMIGDRAVDIQLARNTGVTAVLVGDGAHPQDDVPMPAPDIRGATLLEAARLLLRHDPSRGGS